MIPKDPKLPCLFFSDYTAIISRLVSSSDIKFKALRFYAFKKVMRFYADILLDKYYLSAAGERKPFLENTPDLKLLEKPIAWVITEGECNGGILVFLPGFAEITALAENPNISLIIKSRARVFILHSQMNTDDQMEVFEEVQSNVRKIILSTNIAESSVTISDIKYVIDSGFENSVDYDPFSRTMIYRKQWISKPSALQRKGRAGRTSAGTCFRAYSRAQFDWLDSNPKPALQRCDTTNTSLQVKRIISSSKPIYEFFKYALAPPTKEHQARRFKSTWNWRYE